MSRLGYDNDDRNGEFDNNTQLHDDQNNDQTDDISGDNSNNNNGRSYRKLACHMDALNASGNDNNGNDNADGNNLQTVMMMGCDNNYWKCVGEL